MKLKKLELYGFKSFMDRTEIIFNQGITGIVGPNGSGKSNIGDAVRWVLGEQSPRILRGAKMEDVIFGGTQKRKRASYCEVSLTFDNSDGTLKSAFSEVCVTRRVYRSGDSEYQLNKTSCRLRDIQELFRDTGIGREGYSLIGQGRIDEILSQKSEDRRQVFEEAAGIMTYRVRKEEAERKLQRTGENLTRIQDILHEIESRLDTLQRESEVAKKYQELYERLKALEANIFLLRYDKNIKRTESLRQTIEELKDLLLGEEAKLNDYNTQREAIDRELEALEASLSQCRLNHSQQLEETHQAEIERERVFNKIAGLKNASEDEQRQLEELRDELKTLTSSPADGPDEAALRENVEKIRQESESAQTVLQNLMALEQAAERTLDRHKAEILSAVNRQSDIRDRQTRQTTIRAQMMDRAAELEASIEELERQKQILTEQKQQDEAAQEEAKAALDQSREAVSELQNKLLLYAGKTQNLNAEVQSENLHLQSDKSRLKLLEEMSREMTGYQQAVKKALEYAGKDPRVHGVLARLINVPKDLETAIDMVLGGALQNIVTENEETAKNMIDYLRSNRLGRATFLPISSVRSRVLSAEERKVLSMPGCLGVASELITYDERYRGIIENLLGRTIVADHLEHGIPIMRAGRHAFRLVTLSGDVMHSGGSMTGGTTQSRSVSLLGREREVKDLQKLVSARQDQLQKRQLALENAVREYDAVQAEQKKLQDDLHQKEILLARETEHLAGSQSDLNDICDRLSKTETARAQLLAGISEIDADLNEFNDKVQSVSFDREMMENKTESLQQEMTEKRARTEQQREIVAALQLQLTDAEHALDIHRRDQARREADIARLQAQTQKSDLHLNELSVQREEQERLLSEMDQQLAVKKEQNAAAFAEVNALETQRQQKNTAQRELIHLSEDTHKRMDDGNSRLHRSELAYSKAQSELEQMCGHMLTTYNMTYAGAEALRTEGKFDLTASETEVRDLRNEIREMGNINVSSIEAYETERTRFDELSAQQEDLIKAREDLEKLIDRLLSQMKDIFTGEFEKLGVYFSETFTRLFGGGQAELRLVDATDPLNCGIEIVAQPPGKKLQLLSLLSGGERALTAIAILFAMLKLKPTAFCILDEIEAALDDANIANFAEYLEEYAKTTQFVVVTHRKGTMECCDSLYGVAMEERGVSRMVSVNMQDYTN